MTTPEIVGVDYAAARAGTVSASQLEYAESVISSNMMRLVSRMMRKFGIPLTRRDRTQFAERLYAPVQVARGQSYVLAVRNMEHSAAVAGESIPDPAPIAPYQPDALVKILERTTEPVQKMIDEAKPGRRASVTITTPVPRRATVNAPKVTVVERRTNVSIPNLDEGPSSPRVVVRIAESTGEAVARHARQAGRDAILRTADVAGSAIGWARVTSGATPCPWCAMLASRGPVYRSEQSAIFRAHDQCHCRAVLVFRGHEWEGEDSYQRWNALWTSATKGKRGKDAVRAFNRAVVAQHRQHHAGVRALHAEYARQMFPILTSADLRRSLAHHH
ncbi:VG15 protein [Nocardia vaccinii]|uniref:VG15 protein n=1 Tax=Nocardia vaccinii TaxID=1822 RepID=UPI00082D7197|nr:hypothetical protein [Nocardia vaccinii]